MLLKFKSNVNERDESGNTPLHYTIEKNNKEITELLLLNGADINIKNNDNKIPYDIASDDMKNFIKNIMDKLNKNIKNDK
jgi:ankyrin repeat protein